MAGQSESENTGSSQAEKLLKSGVPVSVGKNTRFKPGQSGNPGGPKPGYKHLSTHIQELLNDEDFETLLSDPRDGWKTYKGAPVKAIIKVLSIKAMQGDVKAFDALARYGWGTKIELGGKVDGELIVRMISYEDKEAGGSSNTS